MGNQIDELVELLGEGVEDNDKEYPLPEKEPIRYSGVDVIILPKGYKGYPTPDSKQQFTDGLDTMKIDLDTTEEEEGILKVPVMVANAAHIYDYDGLRVRKPIEELEAVAAFADNRPVTRSHPGAGIVTDRREVLGFFKSPMIEDGVLKGILEISDKDLIADIKSKKLTDVSPGFFCNLDRSDSGDYDGAHYDASQKDIFMDHVAVVSEGRCSMEDGCGIGMDAKTALPQELVDKLKAAIERAKAMKDKSLVNMLKEIEKKITVQKDSGGDEEEHASMDAVDLVKIREAFKVVSEERDTLHNELDAIVEVEKKALIQSLVGMQSTKTESDLGALTLDDLHKELEMVKGLKVKRLSGSDSASGSERSSRKRIDDAYNKVGV